MGALRCCMRIYQPLAFAMASHLRRQKLREVNGFVSAVTWRHADVDTPAVSTWTIRGLGLDASEWDAVRGDAVTQDAKELGR